MTNGNSQPIQAPPTIAPNSQESEEAVLGAILRHGENYLEVAPILGADDFFFISNRLVWEAFTNLTEQDMNIDSLTVSEMMKRTAYYKTTALDTVGGSSFLTYLTNNTPTDLNAETYARIVQALAVRRQLLDAAGKVAINATDTTLNVQEALDNSSKLIDALQVKARPQSAVNAVVAASDYYEHLQNRYQQYINKVLPGLPTGFREFDRMTGGLQAGKFVVVAGLPGSGKTAAALQAAHNIARYAKVAYFSMEMSRIELMQRITTLETGIPGVKLRDGNLTDDEWGLATEALGRVEALGLWINDNPSSTIEYIRAEAERINRESGLDIIFVDYMLLMIAEQDSDNRNAALAAISRGLKKLAMDLQKPVVALHQLNRAHERRANDDKRPQLNDLTDSSGPGNDADIVMFIHRPIMHDPSAAPGAAEFIVRKHRNGRTGIMPMFFEATLTQFKDGVRENALNGL